MDASDVIRKLQAKAIYSYTVNVTRVSQPTCNMSTCGNIQSTCVMNYTDYATKNLFYIGKQTCISTCTNTCGS